MADFTVLTLDGNVGNTATPSYSPLGGANTEWRWTDVNTAGISTTASASWPIMTRPGAAQIVPYSYAFTADAVGDGIYGGGTTGGAGTEAATFATTQHLQARWAWDNTGTFGSAPLMTAYVDGTHAAITRGTPAGSLLAGHTTDTTGISLIRSYLKGALYGQNTPPVSGPGTPVITDGVSGGGAQTVAAGANWSAWQGLQGDNDWLQFAIGSFGAGPAVLHCMLALFVGPNMAAATYTPKISLKYTFT